MPYDGWTVIIIGVAENSIVVVVVVENGQEFLFKYILCRQKRTHPSVGFSTENKRRTTTTTIGFDCVEERFLFGGLSCCSCFLSLYLRGVYFVCVCVFSLLLVSFSLLLLFPFFFFFQLSYSYIFLVSFVVLLHKFPFASSLWPHKGWSQTGIELRYMH